MSLATLRSCRQCLARSRTWRRSRSAFSAAAIAAIVMHAESTAFAARLPDWAKAIVRTAPPLEDGVPETSSRILFSETRVSVQPDGSRKIRRRFASQALSVGAGEVGIGGYPLRENANVKRARAWHLAPGARVVRSYDPPLEIGLRSSFLTDARTRLVTVEGVRRGSLVFFEFEAIDVPVALAWSQSFAEPAPVALARFELEMPPGWTVRTEWLRQPGPEPAVAGNVHAWELRGLPFAPVEPLGEPASASAPRLIVNVHPPPGASTHPVTLTDWTAMSNWWETLASGRDRVTAEIASVANDIFDHAGRGFYERVRSAATFVRDRVRYLDVEIGIGGYQPHPASETLANFYGDCKDKTMLLRAILSAGGIASYPVAVSAKNRDTVSRDDPAIDSFDHLITAVPVPSSASLPPSVEALLTDGGMLGRLLIVDTTHEFVSIGAIPDYLSGKRALVVAGDRGRLVTIAGAGPDAHTIERRVDLALSPDGTIRGSIVSRHLGQPAADARHDYRQSVAERRKHVEARLLETWFDAEPQDYVAEFETEDGAMVEKLSWTVPPPPSKGKRAILLFPGASEELRRVSLGRRRTAVVYPSPITVRFETRLVGLPHDAELPEAQDLRGDGWVVTTSFAPEGGALVGSWQLVLSRERFEPDGLAELRRLWSAISATAAASARVNG